MSLGKHCRRTVALAAGLFLLLGGASLPGNAGEAGASFNVHVVIGKSDEITVPPPPAGDFCRSSNVPGAFGAEVTVVCSTGVVVDVSPSGRAGRQVTPVPGGAYRYLLPYPWAGVMGDPSDLHTGLGTVTSWRVVHLVDRDYLEMMVRW